MDDNDRSSVRANSSSSLSSVSVTNVTILFERNERLGALGLPLFFPSPIVLTIYTAFTFDGIGIILAK